MRFCDKPVPKRIYMAGKIGPHDWRHEIVRNLSAWKDHVEPNCHWPELHRAIFNRFTYVGPFYEACRPTTDTEGIRANGHGYQDVGQAMGWSGHSHTEYGRAELAECCLSAVGSADLVFVWLDSMDAYGTLVELGYAVGHRAALCDADTDHPLPVVAIGQLAGFDEVQECWFARSIPSVLTADGSTPAEALHSLLIDLGWFFDSPLESAFWEEWTLHKDTLPLAVQHEVLGGKYRLDFAHLSSKTAIEVDGFSYHSDRQQFARDRKRDRDLAEYGWKVIRFAGQELTANIAECVEQAVRMIAAASD